MTRDASNESAERLTNLGHLAAGIGHHVINAFSAIVSNAEILRLAAQAKEPIDPAAVADTIVKTAVEASTVARRLIDYTRPITTAGPSLVALDRLITDIAAEESARLGRAEVVWQVDARPVPPIKGDEAQLRAMLGHLITNALEALSRSGGTITLSTGMDARGWVALEVRDSGAGMSSEALTRAVEPFFSTKGGHFGVGLSIANGIWRRHHGTLAVRSQPGEGTVVRLCVEPGNRQTQSPAPPR
ncbi:MAG TPA: ATP-binding protein [Isosphaeraceae bacterium]|jgi:signal transduction histidine kinase|nr:ATP-binding protein [Isosphaeraceae bacterium]